MGLGLAADRISTRNGMCNGYFYGFLARSHADLLPWCRDATEDRERSVRYFSRDGVVLLYRMYCAQTRCFKNGGGMQDCFLGSSLGEKNRVRKAEGQIQCHKTR